MVNFQPHAAHNVEAEAAHQIVHLGHRAIGAVFDGQHAVRAQAALDCLKHALEAFAVHQAGQREHHQLELGQLIFLLLLKVNTFGQEPLYPTLMERHLRCIAFQSLLKILSVLKLKVQMASRSRKALFLRALWLIFIEVELN